MLHKLELQKSAVKKKNLMTDKIFQIIYTLDLHTRYKHRIYTLDIKDIKETIKPSNELL